MKRIPTEKKIAADILLCVAMALAGKEHLGYSRCMDCGDYILRDQRRYHFWKANRRRITCDACGKRKRQKALAMIYDRPCLSEQQR